MAAAAAYELELAAVLSLVRRAFISAYCIVVVASNWSRAAPLFVAVVARLSKWSSKWDMQSREAVPQPVVGWVDSVVVILWAAIAR